MNNKLRKDEARSQRQPSPPLEIAGEVMSSANSPRRHPRQIIIKGDVWSDTTERLSSSDNVYVGKYRLIIINIYRGVTNRITFLTTLLLLLWLGLL